MSGPDQRIVIDEIVFEVDGPADARANGLASATVHALARELQDLQQERLQADASAPAVHIDRLRVPLASDPQTWPSAAELASQLAGRVASQIAGGRP